MDGLVARKIGSAFDSAKRFQVQLQILHSVTIRISPIKTVTRYELLLYCTSTYPVAIS
jgi:hypothetical protein